MTAPRRHPPLHPHCQASKGHLTAPKGHRPRHRHVGGGKTIVPSYCQRHCHSQRPTSRGQKMPAPRRHPLRRQSCPPHMGWGCPTTPKTTSSMPTTAIAWAGDTMIAPRPALVRSTPAVNGAHAGARRQRQGAIICAPTAVASTVMTPAPQQQQWQWHRGNFRNDASASMATMPKRCQGDVCNDVSM
jgi:hypothetical protein